MNTQAVLQAGGASPQQSFANIQKQSTVFGQFVCDTVFWREMNNSLLANSKLLSLVRDVLRFTNLSNVSGATEGGVRIGEQVKSFTLANSGASLNYVPADYNYLASQYNFVIGNAGFNLWRAQTVAMRNDPAASSMQDPSRIETIGQSFFQSSARLLAQLARDLDNAICSLFYFTDVPYDKSNTNTWNSDSSKRAKLQWINFKSPNKILNQSNSPLSPLIADLSAVVQGLFKTVGSIPILPTFVETSKTFNVDSLGGIDQYMINQGFDRYTILAGKQIGNFFRNPARPFVYDALDTYNWTSNGARRLVLDDSLDQNPGVINLNRFQYLSGGLPYQSFNMSFYITSVDAVQDNSGRIASYNIGIRPVMGAAGTETLNNLYMGSAASSISSTMLDDTPATPSNKQTFYLTTQVPLFLTMPRFSTSRAASTTSVYTQTQEQNVVSFYITNAVTGTIITGNELFTINVSADQLAFPNDATRYIPTVDGEDSMLDVVKNPLLPAFAPVINTPFLPEVALYASTANVAKIPRMRNIAGMRIKPLFALADGALSCVVQYKDTTELVANEDGAAIMAEVHKELSKKKYESQRAELEQFFWDNVADGGIAGQPLPTSAADLKRMLRQSITNEDGEMDTNSPIGKSIDFKSIVSLNVTAQNMLKNVNDPVTIKYSLNGNFSLNPFFAAMCPVFEYPIGYVVSNIKTSAFTSSENAKEVAKYHILKENLSFKHLLLGYRFELSDLTQIIDEVYAAKNNMTIDSFRRIVKRGQDAAIDEKNADIIDLYNRTKDYLLFPSEYLRELISIVDDIITPKGLNLRNIEHLKQFLNELSEEKENYTVYFAALLDILFFSYNMKKDELVAHIETTENDLLIEMLSKKLALKDWEKSCLSKNI